MNNEAMKHTPGPWALFTEDAGTVCKDGSQLVVYHDVRAACGNTVAAVYATYASMANQRANARLIAAAPELLAALSLLCNTCADELDLGSSENGKNNWHALTTARQAIAKAKGEQ